MIPKFVRKKFAGVHEPLGRWILRHVLEFIVLSPAIVVTWIWLKLRRKEILIIGRFSSSITAFIMPLDPILRRRRDSGEGMKNLVVVNLSPDANSQIRKMYDRVVKIYGSEAPFFRRLLWWCSFVYPTLPEVDILECQNESTWHFSEPIVALTNDEILMGEEQLATIGFDIDREFICYATRTESYYKKLQSVGTELKAQSVRNPNEQIYLQVAENLIELNFAVVRMGKDLDSKVGKDFSPKFFDYALKHRTDFLDVFLLARCKFLINGGTGIVIIRAMLNLPTLNTDTYRNHANWFKGDVAIFQRVKIFNKNQIASITEMSQLRDMYSDQKHIGRLGLELVKNSPSEILAACVEMNARIDGEWTDSAEDNLFQTRFWSLICPDRIHHGGRIGAQFLRDNQDLLR